MIIQLGSALKKAFNYTVEAGAEATTLTLVGTKSTDSFVVLFAEGSSIATVADNVITLDNSSGTDDISVSFIVIKKQA